MKNFGYKVRFFLAWYDGWIGYFYDRKRRILYICLLPWCVIEITLPPKPSIYINGAKLKVTRVDVHAGVAYLEDESGRPMVSKVNGGAVWFGNELPSEDPDLPIGTAIDEETLPDGTKIVRVRLYPPGETHHETE